MWERIEAGLRERFAHHPAVRERAAARHRRGAGRARWRPSVAARRLLDLMD